MMSSPNSRDIVLPETISEVFDSDSSQIRSAVVDRVSSKRPNMVLASTYMFPEAAEAGYLMQLWLNGSGGSHSGQWHSLFINSGTEGLSTFIKYCRNKVNRERPLVPCRILVLDTTGTSTFALGHDVPDLRSHRSDGIAVCEAVADFREKLAVHAWDSLVIFADGLDQPAIDEVEASVQSDAHDAVVAWGVLTDARAMERLPEVSSDADVIIVGEAITRRQIPSGVVAMTPRAFDLWNNPTDCVAHVSTFGGNGLAISMIRDELCTRVSPTGAQRRALERMRRSALVRRARLRLHANTWQTRAMDLAGINIEFDSADGVTYGARGRTFVDLASGAGPAYRGHNRVSLTDLAAPPCGSGVDRLEKRLQALTGLDILLPAVSGATAVDMAILAALYARPGKRVIVTVQGNYSGKGAISVSVSRTSNHFRDLDADAFRPFLADVIEIPIDDVRELDEVLGRDDVALVWLEPVQGLDCVLVPDSVIDAVNRNRRPGGYLVGVDEVLTGLWRVDSDRFLASDRRYEAIDICALSKGLSNAIVPIGAAMLSAEVFAGIEANSPRAATWLREHFRNDFSAGLAEHALGDVQNEFSGREDVEAALKEALTRASQSRVFSGFRQYGLQSRLILSPRLWGVSRRREMVDHYEAVVARLLAHSCGAITLQLRILPCVATPEYEELVKSLKSVGAYLEGLSRTKLYTTTAARSFLGVFNELLVIMTAAVEKRRGI